MIVSNCGESFRYIEWPPISQDRLEEDIVGHNAVCGVYDCLDFRVNPNSTAP